MILETLAWGTLWVTGLMLLTWLWHLRTKNAGWVDVAWAFGLGGLAVLYAWLLPGDPARRWLVAGLGGLWGLRLSLHLAVRVGRDPHEDGRYQELRVSWGRFIAAKFLAFFLFQGLLDLVLALPFLLTLLDPSPLGPLHLLAAGLLVLSVGGESLADAQLKRFKARPGAQGQVCREGLWALSRHPNYFFEWLAWIAFALLALPSPWGWLGLVSPLLMLHFLLRVTGIPATEAQALRTKGEAYRRYQQEVSPFIPWLPRRSQP